jgi:hypothetical protein
VNDTFPPGQGEPLNIIISGNSDARALVDSEENGGLRNFFLYVITTVCVFHVESKVLGHLDFLVNVWDNTLVHFKQQI